MSTQAIHKFYSSIILIARLIILIAQDVLQDILPMHLQWCGKCVTSICGVFFISVNFTFYDIVFFGQQDGHEHEIAFCSAILYLIQLMMITITWHRDKWHIICYISY